MMTQRRDRKLTKVSGKLSRSGAGSASSRAKAAKALTEAAAIRHEVRFGRELDLNSRKKLYVQLLEDPLSVEKFFLRKKLHRIR